MTKEDFDKFLDAKSREASSKKAINWQDRKNEWLASLKAFYEKVDIWISDYTDSGKIEISQCVIHLQEEHLGEYKAEMRILKIGSENAVLRPVGTLLIGARGRVDLEGPKGNIKFILTGKNSNGIRISIKVTEPGNETLGSATTKELEPEEEWVWKIATSPPKIQFIELDQDTFFDALTEVLNG